MNILRSTKIKPSHLSRNAYLYIRQSTLRQVHENTESTKRQYALKQKAISMGWPIEGIITIDTDLGQSGATSITVPDSRSKNVCQFMYIEFKNLYTVSFPNLGSSFLVR